MYVKSNFRENCARYAGIAIQVGEFLMVVLTKKYCGHNQHRMFELLQNKKKKKTNALHKT